MSDNLVDHFSGCQISRPLKVRDGAIRSKFDFDFRKIGSKVWRYVNSSNDLDKFNAQSEATVKHGGEYRIVDSLTGKVITRG
jgi:hypothetical protein